MVLDVREKYRRQHARVTRTNVLLYNGGEHLHLRQVSGEKQIDVIGKWVS